MTRNNDQAVTKGFPTEEVEAVHYSVKLLPVADLSTASFWTPSAIYGLGFIFTLLLELKLGLEHFILSSHFTHHVSSANCEEREI